MAVPVPTILGVVPPRFDGGYSSDMAASLKKVLLKQPNAVGFGGFGISPSPATWDGTESGHPNCPAGIWATGNSHCGDPTSPDYVPKVKSQFSETFTLNID